MYRLIPGAGQPYEGSRALLGDLVEESTGTAPGPEAPTLRRLIDRIDNAPLFAHSYAFHFHLLDEVWGPEDLLDFAVRTGMQGVKCHIDSGGSRSLSHASPERRRELGGRASDAGLEWNVEVSSTEASYLARARDIAGDLGAEAIRCYSRRVGRISHIVPAIVADLRHFRSELDPQRGHRLVLEQHEDLSSEELVRIMREIDDPSVRLLFDTTNMITANEEPLAAFNTQAAWISDVHLNDARRIADGCGWAKIGCRTGTGDIPILKLLARLLLLGETEPQIRAIALEEEVNYFAPAYRFLDEPGDPTIPPREPSRTSRLCGIPNEILLADEMRYAEEQVAYIRRALSELRSLAEDALATPPRWDP